MQRILASSVTASLLSMTIACSHEVVIDSNPPGASVRINNVEYGETPVTYSETTGWDKSYRLEVAKPGYKTVKKTLKQNQWNIPVVAASVGGVAIFWWTGIGLASLAGLLFSKQLPDEIVVDLAPGNDVSDAAPEPLKGKPVAQLAY